MNIAVNPLSNAPRPAMYYYDMFDRAFVQERVDQFRDQVKRRLEGALTEEEFRPHRLMNGLYLQLHAYMLRIAIPYGTLASKQMRQLAMIADRWDKGYGHFTTRQNLQFNEIEDPRPTAELIRQWSSAHPEFCYLPRKFKVAVTGAAHDRAAVLLHDIGLRIVRNEQGEIGYCVIAGGGLGRTPMVGKVVRDFVPRADLLAYLAAILSVYNRSGRRDNKYKARIKILVHETGLEDFKADVEAEFAAMDRTGTNADPAEFTRIASYFAPPEFDAVANGAAFHAAVQADAGFARFAKVNVAAHKAPGYGIVTISTKPIGGVPGDVTSAQMRILADLADLYSSGELRISHEQNVILPHVKLDDVHALWQVLQQNDLATANAGLITDIIACPGLDYCALATARSIPIAQAISNTFADPERQSLIGKLGIKISGCINACGHHHIAAIGILGLEKSGRESYQITLGGDPTFSAAIGERLGPGLEAHEVPQVIEHLVEIYLAERQGDEAFIDTYRRIGQAKFKPALEREVEDGSHL